MCVCVVRLIMLNIQNLKITGNSCGSDTKRLYSDWYNFIAVRRKSRRNPCKGLLTYILCSHPTIPSLTDLYQRLNSNCLNFQISHFYIFYILIPYCIIFSSILICITNSYFPTSVEKPCFVYYLYPDFPNVILT